MNNQYQFVSRWRVEGTCGEVADVLGDPLALTRWWPSVYLSVDELRPPDARGLGRRVRLHTKGWLPYTLVWEFEVVESAYPNGFVLVASGDFDGRGEWTFRQDGSFVDITYDWRLRAEKPLLRNLSFLMRPFPFLPQVRRPLPQYSFQNRFWNLMLESTCLTLRTGRRFRFP